MIAASVGAEVEVPDPDEEREKFDAWLVDQPDQEEADSDLQVIREALGIRRRR